MTECVKTIKMEKPARRWDDGLPLGNGKLGAMVMGRVNDETIFINEESLWYGPKRERTNPDAQQNLEKIRTLLMKGHVEKASFLAKMALTSLPKYNNPYQPAGDLRLCWQGHNGAVHNYRRDLNLSNAVAVVEYDMDDVHYRREHFVSSRYQVLVIKLSATPINNEKNHQMTLCANMSRKPFEEHTGRLDKKTVGNWGCNGVGGVNYFTAVRMTADAPVAVVGDFVSAEHATEVIIFVSCKTDFNEKDDLRQRVLDTLDMAEENGYEAVLQAHLEDYQALYNRMDFEVLQKGEVWDYDVSIAFMLESVRREESTYVNQLTMLLVHYARYLIISSSTNCLLPANLQGLWNGSYEPPWQCQYTININTEMNYWFVEKANLAQCHLPLFALIDRLVPNGQKTARELYGCEGFCAHHNTNLWASTDPEGIFAGSPFWVMGGAWLSLHLYEHYLYTGDAEFLRERALPVMGEALRFFKDYLYAAPNGTLLTGPCVSPENTYRTQHGEVGALTMGPTMDCMLLRQLIGWYIEGNGILGKNAPCTSAQLADYASLCKRLPKTTVGDDGRILEWREPLTETEPGHRHISHLYGLHPGNEITRETPQLLEAAAKTLASRVENGGGGTGWSRAWLACFYARLGDGDNLLKNVRELLKSSMQDNLLDSHPPFQIDGNFGIAEAVIEALAQSHAGYIDLLPALPAHWQSGKLQGFCLRGGITANMEWENGALKRLLINSANDATVQFRYKALRTTATLKAGAWQEIVFSQSTDTAAK